MELLTTVVYLALLYAILTLSLNIAIGYSGVLSIGHAMFYAAGAYCEALLSQYWQKLSGSGSDSIPISPHYMGILAICGLLGSVAGGTVGLLMWRVKDDYFLLATLAAQLMLQSYLFHVPWTNGALGIRDIPALSLSDTHLTEIAGIGLIGFAAALVYWVCGRLESSLVGFALRAAASDRCLALTVGESPTWLRWRAFTLSAGLTAIAGALSAPYYKYIDPTFFGLDESVVVFSMVILGGLGTRAGAAVGALVLVLVPLGLRMIEVLGPARGNIEQIMYGSILIVAMRIRPFGILGKPQ